MAVHAVHSAQQLYIFGLGNCDDGRSGTSRLMGPNKDSINEMILLKEKQGEDTNQLSGRGAG